MPANGHQRPKKLQPEEFKIETTTLWSFPQRGRWANLSRDKNFLLIMHEHLFVFRKPALDEKLRPYAESMRWW